MKPQKASDIRKFSEEELHEMLASTQEALMMRNFEKALSQLENPSQIRILRKDIARIKTVLRERNVKI
ncbi:50S ribosomal protein L29 [Chlorobiota bacterium]|jgi:large subunit ribosomal protein L29|nr:50S ribosomal protein L29 [Chlorobiota bacterium]